MNDHVLKLIEKAHAEKATFLDLGCWAYLYSRRNFGMCLTFKGNKPWDSLQ